MDVIGSLLQLYSFGDNIQPVAGFFGRTYKQHPDIANVEVLVKEKYHGGPFGPDHFGIHMPLIGKWLLLVPEVLKYSNAPNHNFHKFAYGKNGVIVFDEAKGPQYMLEHEKNAYLAKYKTMPYLPPVGPKSSAAVSENIDDVPPTSNIIDLVQAHQPLDVEPT